MWTRSVQNMKGYWGQAEETARTLDADGWLETGDAGYLDEDGYLFLTDRVKDMIISGGENVYPAEVENALSDHPAVADVAVIGVPDERWGETVKAIVVRRPGDDRRRPPTSSPSPGAAGALQVPDLGRLRGGAAAQPVGQDPQARAARALLAGPRAAHQLTPRAASGGDEPKGRNAMARSARPKRAKKRIKAQDLPLSRGKSTAKKVSVVKGGQYNPKEIGIDKYVR